MRQGTRAAVGAAALIGMFAAAAPAVAADRAKHDRVIAVDGVAKGDASRHVDILVHVQAGKSAKAEGRLSGAVEELAGHLRIFSVLRPASELAIARAFARLRQYHPALPRSPPMSRNSIPVPDAMQLRIVTLRPVMLIRFCGDEMPVHVTP